MKVGFLLGSFNPIHMGHLAMITSVLNDNLVDEVVIVPTMQNVWKDEKSIPFRDRCFMVQLAIDEIHNCSLSSIDYRTTEPHYSYKTLELLKEEYPNEDLYLIVGADIAGQIYDWVNGDWIMENFQLIIIGRNGQEDPEIGPFINMNIDISSTQIRYLVRMNKQIYPLVPKIISQYINRYNLYRK